MTIKVIKKTEINKEQNHNDNHLSIDYEALIKQLFLLCQKIVNISNSIMDIIDIQDISKIDETHFNEQYDKIDRTIKVFSLVFGKKYTIIDAITKTTTLMNNIQKIANHVGMSLIEEQDNNTNIEIWSEEDVEIMKQIADNISVEQFKKDIDECYKAQQLEIQQKQNLLNKQKDTTEIYEVINE